MTKSNRDAGHGTHASDRELDTYLTTEGTNNRLLILAKWQKSGTTLDDRIVRGLLEMGASHAEIIAAFQICSTSSKPEFELWVMNNLLHWDQNIADVALRSWAKITDRILWHRLLPITQITGRPQRILYTILSIGHGSHGYEITKSVLNSPNWEDLSEAFHALLIERSLQFDLKSDRLTKVARSILEANKHTPHPDHKALLPAIGWLCCHAEKDLQKWLATAPESLWTAAANQIIEGHGGRESAFTKLEKIAVKGERPIQLTSKFPAVWSRHDGPSLVAESIINAPCNDSDILAGFATQCILSATEKNLGHHSWAPALIGFLPLAQGVRFSSKSTAGSAGDSAPTLAVNFNFAASYGQEIFSELAKSRQLACDGKLGIATDKITAPADFCVLSDSPSTPLTHPIKAYFNALCDSKTIELPGSNVWSDLATAVRNPKIINLDTLSATTRKHQGLVTLAYIDTLGRMRGQDSAVLKLLDHIRVADETVLCAVIRALGKIDTQRSLLELIAMLTRTNATIAVQQEIVGILPSKDLSRLQTELGSAIQDLILPADVNDPVYQVKEDLSNLLTSPATLLSGDKFAAKINPLTAATGGDGTLDLELKGMIPHYNELSSEVKRALRTALFFNRTVTDSPHANSIDLSPLIDMQYKAMELLYREFFESAVSQSLHSGAIQRKLDVIGYARPIERQMDEFESYIASLPVVKTIPFFSKFKMRKTLRAICMFQPGRRFTLDGLKAFGMYFLVFGRQECKHGLANTFDIGSNNDLELAEFCKELHIFQDFRNRAAHEGFHPDASNDILGIWRTTASVVQWAFKIRDAQGASGQASRNHAS
jgi:hypothetical protein